MSKLNLPRDVLAKIAQGNPRAIAVLEQALEAVDSTLPSTIEEAQALAAQAQAAAALALAMLSDAAATLAQLATAPAPVPLTEADNHAPATVPAVDADDHAPRAHLGTISSQNHDAVAITGGTAGLDAGAAITPSLWFGGDVKTGLYRTAADKVGVSINQTKLLELSDKLAALTGRAQVDVGGIGTAALPSLYFAADTSTGLYRSAADTIGLTVAGTLLVKFSTTLIDVTGSLKVSQQLQSVVATGTAPLVVTSTTKVTNLYADRAATADSLGTAGAYPSDATDLASAITLVNYIKSRNTSKGV